MRLGFCLVYVVVGLGSTSVAWAASDSSTSNSVEVTADQSLEWYQAQSVYVARGHAKAVRGTLTVESDLLTAHQRDKTAQPPADKTTKDETGDIDRMTAEGNVLITTPTSRITGDRAVYNLDDRTMAVTGKNLSYKTDKQTVTARDALEYYEDRKIAVARGHAVEESEGRRVEGDVLTAEFREGPNGANELNKVTADGHVTIITKNDVVRGDRGVYDVARNIAIITGNVKITRPDGMQLSGDVAETDFASNQSRLLNAGKGRVRALLPSKTVTKARTP